MILSLLYLALSLFGLGFLIFIHEFGHYYVGKKMGMKVETFSIGFGKPLKAWVSEGVKFQLGVIPFGGYVKFKGLDGDRDVKDGFYCVPFYKRIFVAFAGPLSNLLLALVVFMLIYIAGGRRVEFSEKNPFVGFLPNKGLFAAQGLKEGDKITSINDHPYRCFSDFLVQKYTSTGPLKVVGEQFPLYGDKSFEFQVAQDAGFYPAKFLILDKIPSILPQEVAYLKHRGLARGDRIVSLNGQPLFSLESFQRLLQEPSAFIHIKRGSQILAFKVPKLAPSDLKLDQVAQGELTDWTHSAQLKQLNYFIPYQLSEDLVVQAPCHYLGSDSLWQEPESGSCLQKGDQIIAVNAHKVTTGIELVSQLQLDSVFLTVQKGTPKLLTDQEALSDLWAPYLSQEYKELLQNPDLAGQGQMIQFSVPLVKLSMLQLSESEKERQTHLYEQKLATINQIKDAKLRALELKNLELEQNRFMIGAQLVDQLVRYNPSPFYELYEACALTFKTIGSLFKGSVSPKHLSGPVAIVGVMQQGVQKGVAEGLYYFAVISINLALFNLLPLPVLDGGHICFALYEGIVRKPVPQKVIEKLTFVFVILLVGMIIYATYNDLLNLIKSFF